MIALYLRRPSTLIGFFLCWKPYYLPPRLRSRPSRLSQVACRPLNFDPTLPQDLKAQSEEFWEYPLQSRTRLSPSQEKDEMI